MATKQQGSTPSLFNFLKEGLLLPTHNPRLFATLFFITVTSSSLLLLGNNLAVHPLGDKIGLDTKALNSTDPSSQIQYNPQILQKSQDDIRELLLTSAAYALFSIIIQSAIWIVVVFAAVTTYSGELHTFGSLLGKVRTQLKGPLLTLAFVYALELSVYIGILGTMFVILVFLTMIFFKPYFIILFVSYLLLLVTLIFFICFSFLRSMSVVVSVAEPGCHGAGALGRAWRLMKGKLLRAVLLIFVTNVLVAAILLIYTLAKTRTLRSMVLGLILRFMYTILMAAVGLFSTCSMTVFYYECKGSTEASAAEYAMVSTKEQFDA